LNTTYIFLGIFFYFTIILVIPLINRKKQTTPNHYLNLFKPLFPTWKFYDDFEESRLLFYRAKFIDTNTNDTINSFKESTFSDWLPLYQNPKSALSSLFINSHGNLILAVHSHLQTLLQELEDHNEAEPFQESITYKITKNLVSYALKNKYDSSYVYQFKLAVANEEALAIEDILVSPIYEVIIPEQKKLERQNA
jgi:hypothetical protein